MYLSCFPFNTCEAVHTNKRHDEHVSSGLCFFLGGRAFFLFLLACECRERNGVQSDNGLQKRWAMSKAYLTIESCGNVGPAPHRSQRQSCKGAPRSQLSPNKNEKGGRGGTHTLFGSLTRTYLPSGIFRHKSATVLTMPHPFARDTLS
jgi:hypothetical protein